jgi:hypothetical protein
MPPLARLRQSNTLNLNVHTLGQLLDSNSTAGRLMREPLRILFVHALQLTLAPNPPFQTRSHSTTHRKVGHICQEDVDLDDLLDARAGLFQHGLEVSNAGSCLLLDRALNQRSINVRRDLA